MAIGCKVVGVIPAREASTRLPRKLLLAETGQPLIQHTWQAARRATCFDDLVVAAEPIICPLVTALDQLVLLDKSAAEASTALLKPGALVLADVPDGSVMSPGGTEISKVPSHRLRRI